MSEPITVSTTPEALAEIKAAHARAEQAQALFVAVLSGVLAAHGHAPGVTVTGWQDTVDGPVLLIAP